MSKKKNRGEKFQSPSPKAVTSDANYCLGTSMPANFCSLRISGEFQAFGSERHNVWKLGFIQVRPTYHMLS